MVIVVDADTLDASDGGTFATVTADTVPMVTLGLVSSSLPSASPKASCTPDYRVGRRLGREGGTILCVCA